ncbi:MAG: hypothetical protein AAGE01_10355 [Pseudomonadota bacterium]
MAFTEDLSLFFDETEFAVSATFEGGTVLGNFTDLYLEAFEDEGVSTSTPEFECVETDVPNPIGKNLTIGTEIYLIEESRPDGEGITTLVLQLTDSMVTFLALLDRGTDHFLLDRGTDRYIWR